ncbi:hypothetical protein A0256_11960 [Mucilaginibacter sp. PAMC 26640]|nr:hypothetical protein A0256_11960 [Mucilaginibacter sp. PAMC 26640]
MFIIDNEEFERNLFLTQAYREIQLANTYKSSAEILRDFNPMYNEQLIFSFIKGQYSNTEFNFKSAGWNIYPFPYHG